jgi:hypothetical protein
LMVDKGDGPGLLSLNQNLHRPKRLTSWHILQTGYLD